LIEPRWTLSEAQLAVAKLKSNNAAHGCGLVAELLKPVPPEFLMVMVELFNYVLYCFMAILPRHGAKHFSKNFREIKNFLNCILTTDFRPIANIRLLYNFFCVHDFASHRSNFGHGTTKRTKNGFRAGRRMEKCARQN
jgi:hypothetical protein